MFKRFAVMAPEDGGAGAGSDAGLAAAFVSPVAGAGTAEDGNTGAGETGAWNAGAGETGAGDPAEEDHSARPDPAAGAPSGDYQPFTLPGGVPVDRAALDQFTPVARELGLTQEQAQKLVSLHAERMAQANAQAGQMWQQQRQDWQKQARVDPEFGGARFDENLALARRAVDRFGGPDLTEALNATGAGDHPAILKFFAQVARATGEHRLVSPGASGGSGTMSTADYYAREVFGK